MFIFDFCSFFKLIFLVAFLIICFLDVTALHSVPDICKTLLIWLKKKGFQHFTKTAHRTQSAIKLSGPLIGLDIWQFWHDCHTRRPMPDYHNAKISAETPPGAEEEDLTH